MTAQQPSDRREQGYTPRVPRYVTLPSRSDGISRALRRTFGLPDQDEAGLPDDISDLLERLKRINA